MVDYSKYLTYTDIENILFDFEKENPDMMRLSSLCETSEGRKVYLAEITENVNSKATDSKPAYFVQGSIHSTECGGSSAAIHLLDTLLTKKPDILKKVVFYIVPRVNPDGVEGNMLSNAGSRSCQIPNEKTKESILMPKDMNGDGIILQMRKKNPLGDYAEEAPGVMRSRRPGETEGVFYDLYEEGELINYSGAGYTRGVRNYDYNRSYPSNWAPSQVSPEYPLRPAEPRAVAEFLVTHPNIFAGIDFHNGSSGVLTPVDKDDSRVNQKDREMIEKIGGLAEEITGLPLMSSANYSGATTVYGTGTSNVFAFLNLGISHFVIELGNGMNDLGMNTRDYIKAKKPFSEYANEIRKKQEADGYKVFYPFEPYNHPQLGEVEIGGEFMGKCYLMNPKSLPPLIEKTTEFILRHADMRPKLQAANIKTDKLAENLYRVRAQIKNLGILGTKVIKETNSYQAQYPVHISLDLPEGEILSRPNIYEIKELDSMEGCYVEWFVKTPCIENASLKVEHPKAENISEKLI